MEKLIINGARKLSGKIEVSGSKNAVLPIIFASLLIDGETKLTNVPNIGDVNVALDIISGFGAEVCFSKNALTINTKNLKFSQPPIELMRKIRASTYLLGASLSRFGVFQIVDFGGCNFSARPIDLHIRAALALGAEQNEKALVAKKLHGATILLEKPSVGATVNSLILASAAEGESKIFGYAKEPHIFTFIRFLSSAGCKIEVTDDFISVNPAKLHSVEFNIPGDMIEAGSYIIFSLMTEGNIEVSGFESRELASFLAPIKKMGYKIFKNNTSVLSSFGDENIKASNRDENIKTSNRHNLILKNKFTEKCVEEKVRDDNFYPVIVAEPFPGFPTDLQPLIAPLMAKNYGGEIVDTVWMERFGYLDALNSFGIKSTRVEGRAKIHPYKIKSGIAKAPDLRGGASCIAAALSAKGASEIYSPATILRGYDNMVEKLLSLGADIKLI